MKKDLLFLAIVGIVLHMIMSSIMMG